MECKCKMHNVIHHQSNTLIYSLSYGCTKNVKYEPPRLLDTTHSPNVGQVRRGEGGREWNRGPKYVVETNVGMMLLLLLLFVTARVHKSFVIINRRSQTKRLPTPNSNKEWKSTILPFGPVHTAHDTVHQLHAVRVMLGICAKRSCRRIRWALRKLDESQRTNCRRRNRRANGMNL